MTTREQLAGRMADAVIRRLIGKRLMEIKDEGRVRQAICRVLLEDFQAEERLEVDARAMMQDHAKEIRDSAADYHRFLTLVKARLARERGFTL